MVFRFLLDMKVVDALIISSPTTWRQSVIFLYMMKQLADHKIVSATIHANNNSEHGGRDRLHRLRKAAKICSSWNMFPESSGARPAIISLVNTLPLTSQHAFFRVTLIIYGITLASFMKRCFHLPSGSTKIVPSDRIAVVNISKTMSRFQTMTPPLVK